MILSLKNNEEGYTIVEMLVALSLLSLLLYFSAGILGNLALNNSIAAKTQAVNEAKNQLEKTLVYKDFREFEKKIGNLLLLKQTVTKQDELLKIQIEIYHRKTKQMLYRLVVYEKK